MTVKKILCAGAILTTACFSLFSADDLIYKWDFDGKPRKDVYYGNIQRDAGQIGNGARFNGKDSVISIKSSADLNNLDGSFTVSLWFKITGEGSKDKVSMGLVTKNAGGDGVLEPFNFAVWCTDPWGTARTNPKKLWARLGDGKNARELQAACEVTMNKFHHAALVYNQQTHFAYIYFNGAEVAKRPMPEDWRPVKNDDNLTIGVWPAYRNYFEGVIDDVQIYRRALTEKEIVAQYLEGMTGKAEKTEGVVFAVPVTGPIVADGKFTPEKWKNALVVNGLLDSRMLLSNRKVQIYLGRDSRNLYLAVASDLRSGSLKADAKENGEAVFRDDSITLRLGELDYTFNAAGKHAKDIPQGLVVKSSRSSDKWFFEAAIPFCTFAAEKLPSAIRFNIARTYIDPPIDAFDVGEKPRHVDTICGNTAAELRFTEAALPCEFAFGGNLDIGEIVSRLHVVNPRSAAVSGKIEISSLAKTEGVNSAESSEKILRLALDKKFEIAKEPQVFFLSSNVRNGTETVFNRKVPFLVNNNIFDFDCIVERDKGLVTLDVRKYSADAFTGDRKFRVIMTDQAGKERYRAEFDHFDRTGRYTALPVKLADLPDMIEMTVAVSLVNANGREISVRTRNFTKLENAPFLRCTVGEDETVPPPWTPLRYGKLMVDCWNRCYDFNGPGLIRKAVSAGTELLTAPVEFKIGYNGKKESFRLLEQKFELCKEDRAVVSSRAVAEDFNLSTKMTVEFDGMIRVDGKLSGKGLIDSFTLDIPVKEKIAKYLFASRGEELGFSYVSDWQERIGKIPDHWSSRFIPFVWIGDEEKGLIWFAENKKGWNNVKEDREIEIFRKNGQAVLRINYITIPEMLAGGFEFTFGLQATPVRPRPANWRKYNYSGIDNSSTVSPAAVIGWCGNYPNSNIYRATVYDHEKLKNEAKQFSDRGFSSLVVYSQPQIGDGTAPEIRYFLEEWANEKSNGHARSYPLNYVGVNKEVPYVYLSYANKSLHNYWLYHFDKLLTGVPALDGIYYDSAIVYNSNNPRQGCAYAQNGKEYGSYPIFAAREFYKRAYKMVKQHGADKIVVAHISCTRAIPCESFFDIVIDGEHLGGLLSGNDYSYIDTVPLDVWKAQFTARQLGSIPVMLPQLERAFNQQGKKIADNKEFFKRRSRGLLGMLLIHDSNIMNYLIDSGEVNLYLQRLKKFGVENSVFHPYWNNSDLLESFSEKVKISVYRSNGKYLLGIANIDRKDQTGNITLIGIKGFKSANSLVTGRRYPVENSSIACVSVKAQDYEMLVLE